MLNIVILAAGQGKRMQSNTPKVLHPLAGKSMIRHVYETARRLSPKNIYVIIGHQGHIVQEALSDLPIQWVTQTQQLGTGHAVLQALPFISPKEHILILSADVPLVRHEDLHTLCHYTQTHQTLSLLTATLDDPTGLGRILRNEHQDILAIVEEKDANDFERKIKEIYTGICCAPADIFHRFLPALNNHNAQKEYYLTDLIKMAVSDRYPIHSITTQKPISVQGVNDREQLHRLERAFQKEQAIALMHAGATILDAERLDIRGTVHCDKDVIIDVNVILEGEVTLGRNVSIGPHCILKNVYVADDTVIHANSVLEGCHIETSCEIGPFARLRPGTRVDKKCKIGNFVETKNASFGPSSKASHLSYLGDVTIGEKVNIGAGTITCNYDGVNKHQTIIEDGAFIGSDTQLVAPVTVGKNAVIGAGTTLRTSATADALTLTCSTTKTVRGWKQKQCKTLE